MSTKNVPYNDDVKTITLQYFTDRFENRGLVLDIRARKLFTEDGGVGYYANVKDKTTMEVYWDSPEYYSCHADAMMAADAWLETGLPQQPDLRHGHRNALATMAEWPR